MASVRDTFYEMLTGFPSLFTNRCDCIVHLFFVLGNGYEWENGELVSINSGRNGPETPSGIEGYDAYYKALGKLHAEHFDFIFSNPDLGIGKHLLESIKISGASKYLPIFNIPENVTDDWYRLVLTIHEEIKATYTNSITPHDLYCAAESFLEVFEETPISNRTTTDVKNRQEALKEFMRRLKEEKQD